MANGTQSPFLVPSRNKGRFLPLIDNFSNFLQQHMQAQGNLAEKMYAFNKKKEGEAFVKTFGEKLSQSTSIEDVIKNLNEAVIYGSSKGLSQYLPEVEAIGKNTEMGLRVSESSKLATEMYNTSVANFQNAPIMHEGKNTTYGVVAKGINESDLQPESKIALLEQLQKRIGKSDTQLLIPTEKGGKFQIAEGSIDPDTGQAIGDSRQGEVKFDKEKNQYYADYNQSGTFDADESMLPKDVANMKSEERRRKEFNIQIAQGKEPKRRQATYQGENPDYKGKTISVLEKSNGKFYDMDDNLLPDQANWIDRTSSNFFSNQYRNLTTERTSLVTTLDSSLTTIAGDLDNKTQTLLVPTLSNIPKQYQLEHYYNLYTNLLENSERTESEDKVFNILQQTFSLYGGDVGLEELLIYRNEYDKLKNVKPKEEKEIEFKIPTGLK